MSQANGDAQSHAQLLDEPEEIVSTTTPHRRMSTIEDNEIHSKLVRNKNTVPHGYLEPTPDLTRLTGEIKLGWIQGVLIPCLLNIWGVMLFLRISWIVAQAGIGLSIVIIFMSGIVCVITTLSLSAICTNGELQGGGVYYLVSRSLGAELGASVGIIFAFANAVAASMNTIGFCESLNDLLRSHGLKIVDNGVNDIRIVGAVALFVMCVICAIGMDWETKAQNFLIVVIVLAIFNYIIGASIGPSWKYQKAQGFIGLSMENAKRNWLPDFRFSEGRMHNFFSVFAMYFPAVTGVQAGANICGDLRNPATAIPKGTLLALGISISSYLTLAMLAGIGALRDASGDSSNMNISSLEACKPNCYYGLHNNYEVMQLMALWSPLIYGGCWAATLSTALTNLLSVPRLIQALGVDRIYPGLIYFSKPYGKHGEPYRGYVLTFTVSLLFLLIADLNTIAPLITNFYLASYSLINFCTFHACVIKPISWRPTFRCYNTWLSLVGFLMCVGMMMIISWVMALITTFIFMTLYLLVIYTKPNATWGSSTEVQRYQETIARILQISRQQEHTKTYNPQLLVMAGKPYLRPALLDIGNLITRLGSFMIVADVEEEYMEFSERNNCIHLGEDWLQSRKHRAFFVLLSGVSIDLGIKILAQSTGLGKLQPNVLLIGFQDTWRIENNMEQVGSYVRGIQNAFDEQLAVAILRAPKSARPIDSDDIGEGYIAPTPSRAGESQHAQAQMVALMHSNSDIDSSLLSQDNDGDSLQRSDMKLLGSKARWEGSNVPVTLLEIKKTMSLYEPLTLESEGSIDTWWLYDDGGLNILLPYILARRSLKQKKSLRVFALPRGGYKNEDAQKYLEALLLKYRIDYTELILVSGIRDAPSEASWELFDSFCGRFKTDELQSDILITETEFKRLYTKTCRHLRLRELMIEHSSNASLIAMSLPLPRKGLVSAAMYMAWLEVMSKDLPPVLFIRGNDSVVLDA